MDAEIEIHLLRDNVKLLQENHRHLLTRINDIRESFLIRMTGLEARINVVEESTEEQYEAARARHDLHRFNELPAKGGIIDGKEYKHK